MAKSKKQVVVEMEHGEQSADFERLEQLCRGFDTYYEMSDDGGKVAAGMLMEKEIKKLIPKVTDDELLELEQRYPMMVSAAGGRHVLTGRKVKEPTHEELLKKSEKEQAAKGKKKSTPPALRGSASIKATTRQAQQGTKGAHKGKTPDVEQKAPVEGGKATGGKGKKTVPMDSQSACVGEGSFDGTQEVLKLLAEGKVSIEAVKLALGIKKPSGPRSGQVNFGDHSITSVIRALALDGWSLTEIHTTLLSVTGHDIPQSTLRCQIGGARNGSRGEPAGLSDEEWDLLRKIRAGAAD